MATTLTSYSRSCLYVAVFLIESYKRLQPSSSDTAISPPSTDLTTTCGLSNGSSISSGLPGQDLQPSTSTSAVRVNILWFTSLVLGLAYALLAMPMQQWVCRYLQTLVLLVQARLDTSLLRRSRAIRPSGCCEDPSALHVSVFLFFAALVDFLININHIVAFSPLQWWSERQRTLYLQHFLSFSPIRHTR